MSVELLIGIESFAALIFIIIVTFMRYISLNSCLTDRARMIIVMFCSFMLIIVVLTMVLFGYIKYSKIPLSLHHYVRVKRTFKLKPIRNSGIAYGMDVIALVFLSPILILICDQIKNYIHHNWNHFLPYLLVILDIITIISILWFYLITSNTLRIYGHAHYLFPLVLGCTAASLVPEILSVYMRLDNLNRRRIINGVNHLGIHFTVNICYSRLIDVLSMLGIAVTFDSLSFTADWPVSVGFVYWGTYVFVIVSLFVINFLTIYRIKASYRIKHPNND